MNAAHSHTLTHTHTHTHAQTLSRTHAHTHIHTHTHSHTHTHTFIHAHTPYGMKCTDVRIGISFEITVRQYKEQGLYCVTPPTYFTMKYNPDEHYKD
jgi:translation initiation factor 2B subunit (eIF-2B alpha/beta/delta family)